MTDRIKLEFDLSHDTGPIPCVVWLYRKNGGYVVDSIDASNHDGGELPESVMKRIDEKACELALNEDIET